MNLYRKQLTGIILAGGKSSRMGEDKGMLIFQGKKFIEHIISVLETVVHEVVIVSNNVEYDQFNKIRITDFIENAGPLAGLYSGLNYSKTAYNLVLSCDIPLINKTILEELIIKMEAKTAVAQIKSEGKIMPLIALYKKECEKECLILLNKGERRLRSLSEVVSSQVITIDEAQNKYTMNVNTPLEFKKLQNGNYN